MPRAAATLVAGVFEGRDALYHRFKANFYCSDRLIP